MAQTLVIFHFEEALFLETRRIGYEAVAGAMRYFGIPPLSRRFVESLQGLDAREVAEKCLATQNEGIVAPFEEKLIELGQEASSREKALKAESIQMLRILHDADTGLCVYTGRPEFLESALKKAGVSFVKVMPLQESHLGAIGAIKNLLPTEKAVLVADDEEALEAGRLSGCVLVRPASGKGKQSGFFGSPPDMEELTSRILKETGH